MDVEPAGNFQDILSSLEAEVTELCNNLSAELFVSLLDKWEADVAHDRATGTVDMHKLLMRYVGMKITLHHMNRKYRDDEYWTPCSPNVSELGDMIEKLKTKIYFARRDYYVAKRRAEGEHGNDCTCRGCKCIGQDG